MRKEEMRLSALLCSFDDRDEDGDQGKSEGRMKKEETQSRARGKFEGRMMKEELRLSALLGSLDNRDENGGELVALGAERLEFGW